MQGDILDLLEAGELWTYARGAAAVANGATVTIGITTGDVPVRVLSRTYTSTGSPMDIRLYRVAWTGGSALLQAYNRNREFANVPQPVAMLAGVTFTPNTPEITARTQAVTGAGNAQLSVPDDQPLNLLKNTQYVLELYNAHSGNADLACSITLRRKQASERLR